MFQGRIPGTSKWKPVNENPEAEEDVPGALIVRLRDNLDFGSSVCLVSVVYVLTLTFAKPMLRNLKVCKMDHNNTLTIITRI